MSAAEYRVQDRALQLSRCDRDRVAFDRDDANRSVWIMLRTHLKVNSRSFGSADMRAELLDMKVVARG